MHIVMVNAHWSNRGDEAAVRAIIDGLLLKYKDITITIIFKDSQDIGWFPYSENINYITSKFLIEEDEFCRVLLDSCDEPIDSDLNRIKTIIQTADAVIYAPGGSVISDRFWWKKQLEYLFPIAYAEKMKIPTVFAAPSMGPFNEKHELRNKILDNVDVICVREDISYRELKKIGVTKNVLTTIDSAFLNQINIEYNQMELYKNEKLVHFLEGNIYKTIVGITISDFKWHVEYGKNVELRERIKSVFDAFIYKLGCIDVGVLLIPQLFGNQNDREYLKLYQAENTYLLEEEYDAYFQQYIISKLYAVVGMRYHSNIFAAKVGIPFIPIIYEEKMRGFVECIGWKEYAEELHDLSLDSLYSKYISLTNHYTALQQKLKNNAGTWQQKAEKTLNEIVEVIDGQKGEV